MTFSVFNRLGYLKIFLTLHFQKYMLSFPLTASARICLKRLPERGKFRSPREFSVSHVRPSAWGECHEEGTVTTSCSFSKEWWNIRQVVFCWDAAWVRAGAAQARELQAFVWAFVMEISANCPNNAVITSVFWVALRPGAPGRSTTPCSPNKIYQILGLLLRIRLKQSVRKFSTSEFYSGGGYGRTFIQKFTLLIYKPCTVIYTNM